MVRRPPSDLSVIARLYERWSPFEDKRREISDDLKALFAEIKAEGLNPKAARAAFAEFYRLDHQTADEADKRALNDADVELYLAALARVREGEPDADPETGEIVEPSDKLAKAERTSARRAKAARSEPKADITEPVTAAGPGDAQAVPTAEASPEQIAEPPGQDDPQAAGRAHTPSPAATPSEADVVAAATDDAGSGASPDRAEADVDGQLIPPATVAQTVPDGIPGQSSQAGGGAVATPAPLDTRTSIQRTMDEVLAKREAEKRVYYVPTNPDDIKRRPGETWVETNPPMGMVRHEYNHAFPDYFGNAHADIVDDIRANGIQRPIIRIGNVILDGWTRYTIARDLKIPYPVKEYDGNDPLADLIRWQLETRGPGLPRQSVASRLMKLVPDRAPEIAELFGVEFAHVEKTRRVA